MDDLGHDGLVINGTTGEAPTTSDGEKADLLHAVVEAVGDRAAVLAGVGTFNTEHTLELAADAAKLGVDGLLVVTPYYSKPPQAGLLEHFRRVADATEVPVMLYDIPGRAGTAIRTETMLRLAEHPRIVAVKDAKGDLTASAQVMAECDLAYYSGDDAMTLPLLSVGAVGVVGTSTHFSGRGMKAMIEAYVAGDVAEATRLHRQLLPIFTGIFATQGCILVKAGLALQGRPVGGVRSPLVVATPAEVEALRGRPGRRRTRVTGPGRPDETIEWRAWGESWLAALIPGVAVFAGLVLLYQAATYRLAVAQSGAGPVRPGPGRWPGLLLLVVLVRTRTRLIPGGDRDPADRRRGAALGRTIASVQLDPKKGQPHDHGVAARRAGPDTADAHPGQAPTVRSHAARCRGGHAAPAPRLSSARVQGAFPCVETCGTPA